MHFLATVVSIGLLTLPATATQDDEPRVFAGGSFIYGLQISLDTLKLESALLEARIRRSPSPTVLLILPPKQIPQPVESMEPNEAGAAEPRFQYPIDICQPGETILTHMQVTRHDHEALRELADDVAFLMGASARAISMELPSEEREQQLTEVVAKINSLPRATQDEARYCIGQMMADRNSENPSIQQMVRQYRTEVEQNVIAQVAGEGRRDFIRGRLYQFGGTGKLSQQQIQAIDPEQVRTVDVNGSSVTITWLGDKMLMMAAPSPDMIRSAPSGLELRSIPPEINELSRPEPGMRQH